MIRFLLITIALFGAVNSQASSLPAHGGILTLNNDKVVIEDWTVPKDAVVVFVAASSSGSHAKKRFDKQIKAANATPSLAQTYAVIEVRKKKKEITKIAYKRLVKAKKKQPDANIVLVYDTEVPNHEAWAPPFTAAIYKNGQNVYRYKGNVKDDFDVNEFASALAKLTEKNSDQ